ncbi:MAG TPA: LysR family transcriptional regulator [Kofleriaceae bacterium]|nr:LysR family transcriptional regulator [Kofleriaceae bacterium]
MWRCFEAAATFRTFRRAARELSLSMRMFEYRIKRLELALGTELFIRAYGRAILTAEGERLLPQAFRMLEQAASPGRPHEPPPLELTVGAPADLGVSWLAHQFERLHAYRPDRTLRVQLGDADDLLGRIRDGALDCAITSVEQVGDGLACEVLHRQELVFVAATSLVRRRPFSQRAHAARHVLIDLSDDLPLFRTVLEALGDREPWGFARIECFETVDAIRDRLLQGDGVAVLPRRIVARDLRARRLKQLMRDVELPHEAFVLVWRRDHQRELEIQRLAGDLARAPL